MDGSPGILISQHEFFEDDFDALLVPASKATINQGILQDYSGSFKCNPFLS